MSEGCGAVMRELGQTAQLLLGGGLGRATSVGDVRHGLSLLEDRTAFGYRSVNKAYFDLSYRLGRRKAGANLAGRGGVRNDGRRDELRSRRAIRSHLAALAQDHPQDPKPVTHDVKLALAE